LEGNKWKGRTFAEFALIVVGVLVALALEGWWSTLQDHRAESEYISDLYDEMERNVIALDGVGELRSEAEAALTQAAYLLETGQHLDSAEVFVVSLVRGGTFQTVPRITNSVFEDLRSSGRLRLIQNDKLRRSIMNHYGRLDATLLRLRRGQEDLRSGLAALLARHLPPGMVETESVRDPMSKIRGPAATPNNLRAVAEALATDANTRAEIRAELATLEGEALSIGRLYEILDEHRSALTEPDADP